MQKSNKVDQEDEECLIFPPSAQAGAEPAVHTAFNPYAAGV